MTMGELAQLVREWESTQASGSETLLLGQFVARMRELGAAANLQACRLSDIELPDAEVERWRAAYAEQSAALEAAVVGDDDALEAHTSAMFLVADGRGGLRAASETDIEGLLADDDDDDE